ncbi:hypothetical protein FOCC_FOCC011857, partial [Frankliniella occidentalis]
MTKLARRYLVVPASSAESERTFSDAGWILNKRRKNLEMSVVDDLLFLHCNCRDKVRRRLQDWRMCASLFSTGSKGKEPTATTTQYSTTGLNRHSCTVMRPSPSTAVDGTVKCGLVKAKPAAKKDVCDATAQFCAVDLRPLSIVEGDGFRALAQVLILIGDKFGKVDIDDLLSDPKTIKKRINELAESERAELYPRVRAAAEAGEIAATLDMWAEDTTKVSVMTCNIQFPELNSATNEWETRSYNFFTEPFPKGQSKSAENLRAFIVKMFGQRGINEELLERICFVTDGEAALKNALNQWWWEYCSAHAYNIVYTHAMTVAPKDFQSLPAGAESVAKKVEEIVAALRKLRNGKIGKKIITDAKLTFPKTFARSSCVAFVNDHFLKIRDVLSKSKTTDGALEILNELHVGDLAALKQHFQDLEQAVGRIGHTSGSALPAVLQLCQTSDLDTEFVRELRTHLAGNKSLLVLRVLQLKEACSALVTYMKSTGHNSELTYTLKPYMEVRWNSLHRMLSSIQKVWGEWYQQAKIENEEDDDDQI